MNFANVKALAIPEGNVKQIADGQGVVLWKKGADWEVKLYTDTNYWTDREGTGLVKKMCPYINGSFSNNTTFAATPLATRQQICRFRLEGKGLTGKKVKLLFSNYNYLKQKNGSVYYTYSGTIYECNSSWSHLSTLYYSIQKVPYYIDESSESVDSYVKDFLFFTPDSSGNLTKYIEFNPGGTSNLPSISMLMTLGFEVVDNVEDEIIWLTPDTTTVDSSFLYSGAQDAADCRSIVLPQSLINEKGISAGDIIKGIAFKWKNTDTARGNYMCWTCGMKNITDNTITNISSYVVSSQSGIGCFIMKTLAPNQSTPVVQKIYAVQGEFEYEGNNIGIGIQRKRVNQSYNGYSGGTFARPMGVSNGVLGTGGYIKYGRNNSSVTNTWNITPAIGLIVRRNS